MSVERNNSQFSDNVSQVKPIRGRPVFWTPERALDEAKKYSHPEEFKINSPKAYNAIGKYGLREQAYEHMVSDGIRKMGNWRNNSKWTLDQIRQEAAKYSRMVDFQKACWGAYQAARKMGVIGEVTSHYQSGNPIYWTRDRILEEAKKYSNRGSFSDKSNRAYCAARRYGILDEVCSHMDDKYHGKRDSIYIWEALDAVSEGVLCKVGLTSAKLGDKRIREVASKFSFTPITHIIRKTSKDPHKLEKSILSRFYRSDILPKYQGYSEFRVLDRPDIKKLINEIQEW